MRVTMLYFASLREQKGCDSETVEVDGSPTVSELYASLFDEPRVPVAYARNEVYAQAWEPVEDGDVVAFIPPIGGG